MRSILPSKSANSEDSTNRLSPQISLFRKEGFSDDPDAEPNSDSCTFERFVSEERPCSTTSTVSNGRATRGGSINAPSGLYLSGQTNSVRVTSNGLRASRRSVSSGFDRVGVEVERFLAAVLLEPGRRSFGFAATTNFFDRARFSRALREGFLSVAFFLSPVVRGITQRLVGFAESDALVCSYTLSCWIL